MHTSQKAVSILKIYILIQTVSSSLAAQEEKREKNPPTQPEIAKMWTILFLVQQYRHLHRVLMISLEHLL